MLAPAMEWRKPPETPAPALNGFEVVPASVTDEFIVFDIQSRAMLAYFAAIPLSLLPERTRERWMQSSDPALRIGAIFSGLLQFFVFFVLANILRLEDLPLTVILYFSAEGLVRFIAAFAVRQLLPSLPFWLMSLATARRQAERERLSRPKSVSDVVESASGDLLVRSCAAKDWNQFTTVRYCDALYELANEEQGDPARPFCYRLRPVPEGKLIRGIRDYSPEEALQQH